MAPESLTPRKRRWWTGRKFWILVILNLAGLLLIIPLLQAVMPLLNIWWNTHSQANFRQHEQAQARRPAPGIGIASNVPALAEFPVLTNTNAAFTTLSNQLSLVTNVTPRELTQMVALAFGSQKRAPVNPKEFDLNSSVFEDMTRTNFEYQGTNYYCYVVDLVDQNGNHKIDYDFYTEPNLENERTMATMALIKRNPQLKMIYAAMANLLAEKTAVATNAVEPASTNQPVPVNEKVGDEIRKKPDQ